MRIHRKAVGLTFMNSIDFKFWKLQLCTLWSLGMFFSPRGKLDQITFCDRGYKSFEIPKFYLAVFSSPSVFKKNCNGAETHWQIMIITMIKKFFLFLDFCSPAAGFLSVTWDNREVFWYCFYFLFSELNFVKLLNLIDMTHTNLLLI